jgi:hypothetical protein
MFLKGLSLLFSLGLLLKVDGCGERFYLILHRKQRIYPSLYLLEAPVIGDGIGRFLLYGDAWEHLLPTETTPTSYKLHPWHGTSRNSILYVTITLLFLRYRGRGALLFIILQLE